MSEINLFIPSMEAGLRVRKDETQEPAGSFRLMRNAIITDRGGVAKRPGMSVIGDYDSGGLAVKGLFAFEKADGTDTLLKSSGTVHQYLDTTWEDFETGLTASKVGYAPFVVNDDDEDYLFYSSRENGYRRWRGWYDRTTAGLAGGETKIPVTTVLKADIYYSGTASSVSTTTIDVTGTPWATEVWTGFVVRITSGAQEGKVSAISATTTGQITFTAIAGLSGTPTFEIRQLAIPSSGTVLINGTEQAYTGVVDDDGLVVASAPVATISSPVVLKSDYYPENPRGDALGVALTKIYVGNIKSAISNKGSGDVATSVSRAVYVSATGDGTDFTFSAPRSANEGDVIEYAYGGGRVLDVIEQEKAIYAGTPNYIEETSYTQVSDANGDTDLLQRIPLKPGIGLAGKFIKGKDDVYMFTPSGEFTSLGRVAQKDSTPQSLDLGLPIKRLLNDRVNDEACGIEYRNRLLLAHKYDSDSTHNDRILVFNRNTNSFEGDWLIPASCFTIWDDKPACGQSNGSNAFQLYEGEADVWNSVEYPIHTKVLSNWINVTPSTMEDQAVTGIHVAGHIRGNSEFDWYLYSDFSDTPVLSVNFSGNEDDFTYSANISGSLGTVPLATEPLASIDEADADGYRRFRFSIWVPEIYCNQVSWGFDTSGANEYVEVNQIGITVMADPLTIGPGITRSIT